MPQSAEIAITNKCNLKCRYCFHFGSDGDVKQELPAGEWLKFFDELKRIGVLNITIQGGEPFCREDLEEIIYGISQRNMRFTILTNGGLITDDMARLLVLSKACSQVQVSIDGASSRIHDSNRGKGSFAAAINGIRALKKQGVNVGVRVTINKLNVMDLENIAKLLLEDIGLQRFSTNEAFYMGLCKQNYKKVQLDAKDKSIAMDVLLRLTKKYGGRINATAGPLQEARDWIMMERAVRQEKTHIAGPRGKLISCNGPMMKIGVRADGVIVPCLLMSHLELGRINKDDIVKVWKTHPVLKELRLRKDIPLTAFKSCRECIYVNYCGGSCPALSYTSSGNEYGIEPSQCFKQFLEGGGKLPDEKLLLA